MSEPTVNVMLRLPASVLAQLPEAVSAATGLPPPPNRAATVTAALGAFLVHSRQIGAIRPPAPPASAAPVLRQRLKAISVPQHSTRG